MVEDNKPVFLVDFHPKTDLGKGRAPVGRQLGFSFVKPSLSSIRVVVLSVNPQGGFVKKGFLKLKKEKKSLFKS